MKEAKVSEGVMLREQILKIFKNEEIDYIQVHNAGPGCYIYTVERA
jgi:hypothetical protein